MIRFSPFMSNSSTNSEIWVIPPVNYRRARYELYQPLSCFNLALPARVKRDYLLYFSHMREFVGPNGKLPPLTSPPCRLLLLFLLLTSRFLSFSFNARSAEPVDFVSVELCALLWVLNRRKQRQRRLNEAISAPISLAAPAVTGSIVMSAADKRTRFFRRQDWLQADALGT